MTAMTGVEDLMMAPNDDYMRLDVCSRLHDEQSARIDLIMKQAQEKMATLEKNIHCINRHLSSIKTWVIVTLAALLVDLARGFLVYLKVAG